MIEYHISDHLPIFSVFNWKLERQRLHHQYEKRVYTSVGKLDFVNSLQTSINTLLDNSNNFDDPENILNDMIVAIKHAEDKAFPLRKMSRKKSRKFRTPWMTKGILTSINKRDKLFREQLGKNDEELSKAYRKYRNKVNRIIERANDMDLLKSFENIVDNPKKVWCKINTKFLHKKHCGSALPSELRDGSHIISEKSAIANKLNEHFVNKGHILASKLPEPQVSILHSMKDRSSISIKSWKKCYLKEVLDIISKEIALHKAIHN